MPQYRFGERLKIPLKPGFNQKIPNKNRVFMDIHKTLLDLRPIMCYTTSALGAEGNARECMISRKQSRIPPKARGLPLPPGKQYRSRRNPPSGRPPGSEPERRIAENLFPAAMTIDFGNLPGGS